METITLYTSRCFQNKKNTEYPIKALIKSAEDLTDAVKVDHVAATYRNNERSKDNFICSDCLIMDLDNDHSENPADWKKLEDVQRAFPDVPFYAVGSRNHMRAKGGESARPRYHFYFPIHEISDHERYASLKVQAKAEFPYFCGGSLDAARFLYGVENPEVHESAGGTLLDTYLVLYATKTVADYIKPKEHGVGGKEKVAFGRPLEPGERNTELHRYAFKLFMQGLEADDVLHLTNAYNETLQDPLPIEEVQTLVRSADKGSGGKEERKKARQKADLAIEFAQIAETENKPGASPVLCLSEIDEQKPEWLIDGYIPKGEITVLAGDGGVGKTFVWCAFAAAISTGKRAFVLNNAFTDEIEQEPKCVLYFSSEDSNEAVLRPRLRSSGADLTNIFTIDSAHEDFQRVKLNSDYLERLLNQYHPALVIFDPLQSFLPARTDMAARNQMREAMAKLHVYGKKYGTTFLIVMHTNKQQNVSGRGRLADSADIWDIARSVLICGEADSKSQLKYLSQEKSSYGKLSKTVLFRIDGNTVVFMGYSDKRDFEYKKAASKDRTAPEREAAEQFILDYLQCNGKTTAKELQEAAGGDLIKNETLRRAKEKLKKDNKIRLVREGKGNKQGVAYYYEALL